MLPLPNHHAHSGYRLSLLVTLNEFAITVTSLSPRPICDELSPHPNLLFRRIKQDCLEASCNRAQGKNLALVWRGLCGGLHGNRSLIVPIYAGEPLSPVIRSQSRIQSKIVQEQSGTGSTVNS